MKRVLCVGRMTPYSSPFTLMYSLTPKLREIEVKTVSNDEILGYRILFEEEVDQSLRSSVLDDIFYRLGKKEVNNAALRTER